MAQKFYHGTKQCGPYFEGYYLKLQTKSGAGLALIPAIHIDAAGRRSASLQVIAAEGSWWLDYPGGQFYAAEKTFFVRLGGSVFTAQGLRLGIERPGLSLRGSVRFGPFTPLASDIMGPFRFVPGMECAHGVLSMAHRLEGTLVLNGQRFDFTGGTGYIETDRGQSFPQRYLWTQCVWAAGRCSLMLSVATVALPVGSFTGCICAVRHGGREYRLATYRGARIVRWSGGGAVVRQGDCRLEITLLKEHSHPLRAPRGGSMRRTVHESLCARVRYRFWRGGRLLFAHTDDYASFEHA